jgi:hypothetical protein
MIDYIAILKQNGEMLYSKNIIGQTLEEEILMGFFASVSNFSQVALQMFVDEISLGEYKKIVLVMAPYEKLIIGAIVDREDSKRATQRLLNEMLIRFIGAYGPNFQRSLIKIPDVENMWSGVMKQCTRHFGLKQKVKNGFILGFLGLIVRGISFLIGINLMGLFNITNQNIDPTSFALLGTLNVLLLYGFPVFLDGYLTGIRKTALRNVIIYLIIIQISYRFDTTLLPIISGYLPVSIILAIVFSLAGVYYAQQKVLIYTKRI